MTIFKTLPVYNIYYTMHYLQYKTISFLIPKVWNMITSEIKGKESIEAFKCAMKTWRLEHYTPQVEFI